MWSPSCLPHISLVLSLSVSIHLLFFCRLGVLGLEGCVEANQALPSVLEIWLDLKKERTQVGVQPRHDIPLLLSVCLSPFCPFLFDVSLFLSLHLCPFPFAFSVSILVFVPFFLSLLHQTRQTRICRDNHKLFFLSFGERPSHVTSFISKLRDSSLPSF